MPVAELVGIIKHSCIAEGFPYHPPASGRSQSLSQHAVATIWGWLVERGDVSVGRDREYNHMSLEDMLSLSQQASYFPSPQPSSRHATPQAAKGQSDHAQSEPQLLDPQLQESSGP